MPRETLTKEQIVQTAVELLDSDGVEGLSMRQLGSRLNSAATAVYWHVKSKDDLVVLAADAVWAEIELPDLDETPWRAAATAMAKGLYAMILRHPWLVPAMSTHLLYGPGKSRHDDHLLAVYQAAGFTGQGAERAMKTVFTFVLGTALGVASEAAWRSRLRRTGGDEQEQARELVARATEIAMRFPRLRAHTAAHQGEEPGLDLEFGLRTILNGLQAELDIQEA
ncbi:TetR/AcrR family transcriptional regulator [Nonomuraea gerenzanensis]|uniref:Transcriptional regulator, TetR family n=1 Tax=Nonomuraea gerenzanensis TaxID=93944 RepID=A0A1M4EEC5_9ACTN|nr:TetR/AcrR family transcriptional regulator [Nonomuraea gerenzanensis]UBU08704.1 TetR/AcrR family transcriptional regulator [Nonomuraea gerenzanensis]SBO97066.1 Transcriptional regulator, TetR family [Nonomuraea gerenzanensis]